MSQITYSDKSDISTSSVPATNKIVAADMNEIKSVVNANDTLMGDLTSLKTTSKTSVVSSINELVDNKVYSTNEINTGKKWIDNKAIYRKCFTQTTLGDISTGITVDQMITMNCLVKQLSSNVWRNIPWLFNGATSDWQGGLYYTNGTIKFQVGSSLGSIDKVIVVLEYTK